MASARDVLRYPAVRRYLLSTAFAAVGLNLLGLRVTGTRVIAFAASVLICLGIHAFLGRTETGLQMVTQRLGHMGIVTLTVRGVRGTLVRGFSARETVFVGAEVLLGNPEPGLEADQVVQGALAVFGAESLRANCSTNWGS